MSCISRTTAEDEFSIDLIHQARRVFLVVAIEINKKKNRKKKSNLSSKMKEIKHDFHFDLFTCLCG